MLLAALRYGNPNTFDTSDSESDYMQTVYRNLTSRGVEGKTPVDTVIEKLLRVHPSDRYRQALGAVKDFEECIRILQEDSFRNGFVPGRYDYPPYLEIPDTIRGREAEHTRRFTEIAGSHSRMIGELIPAWKNLLPAAGHTGVTAGPMERQNIIRKNLTEILKEASNACNPTVFFVDDMQWVDPASLQLIMDIADIPGMKFLLFIGAYRSNEVGKDHPLSLRGSTN
jgi:hypothetical protein